MDRLIFKNYTFIGKHARFVADLTGDKTNSFFKTNISLFVTAAMIGIAQNVKSERDTKSTSEKSTKIEEAAAVFAQTKLWLALQLAVMHDRDSDIDVDTRLRKLYESDSIPAEYKKLLEQFMLGGLEYLHKHLWVAGSSTPEKIFRMNMFAQRLQKEYEKIRALDILNKAGEVMNS